MRKCRSENWDELMVPHAYAGKMLHAENDSVLGENCVHI